MVIVELVPVGVWYVSTYRDLYWLEDLENLIELGQGDVTTTATLAPTPAPTMTTTTTTAATTPGPTFPIVPVVSSPSSAPNVYDTVDTVLRLLGELSLDGGFQLRSPDTPQHQAFQWLVHNFTLLESYNQTTIVQRYVLATLYYSTRGSEWTDNDGWLTAQNECDWYFRRNVFSIPICDDLGRLQKLELNGGNGLVGTLPPELALLSNSLRFLDLSSNQLKGTLPPGVGRLTRLERLDAASNQLSGTIPSELGRLTLMTWFNVANNPTVSGTIPTELFAMSSCTHMGLTLLNVTGPLPSEIGRMTALTRFMMRGGHLSALPTELGRLTQMTQLLLSDNAIQTTVPSQLGQLTNLLELDLSNNDATGTLPYQLFQLHQCRE